VPGKRDPATVSSVQNPVAAELIEGTERMKARTYSLLIVWGRASRMSDLEKPSLQVGDVPADFHALTRRRNLHRDKRGCCEKANGMIFQ
jgi:hypothetical protein